MSDDKDTTEEESSETYDRSFPDILEGYEVSIRNARGHAGTESWVDAASCLGNARGLAVMMENCVRGADREAWGRRADWAEALHEVVKDRTSELNEDSGTAFPLPEGVPELVTQLAAMGGWTPQEAVGRSVGLVLSALMHVQEGREVHFMEHEGQICFAVEAPDPQQNLFEGGQGE